MPKHTPPHRPYDLTTPHGRAQSYAHGKHGAFLVSIIEQALEEQAVTLRKEFQKELEKEISDCVKQLSEDWQKPHSFSMAFENFRQELGKRDKLAFEPLVDEYKLDSNTTRKDLTVLFKFLEKVTILSENEDE